MKTLLCFLIFCFCHQWVSAQKFSTSKGKISFIAPDHPSLKGTNQTVKSELDAGKGSLTFEVSVKGFALANQGMQEKYETKVMESDKFPKNHFSGQIINRASINFSKNGEYKVQVKGNLLLHGVEKMITVPGTILVKDKQIQLYATFAVLLTDYIIFNPGVGESIQITVECTLDKAPEQ